LIGGAAGTVDGPVRYAPVKCERIFNFENQSNVGSYGQEYGVLFSDSQGINSIIFIMLTVYIIFIDKKFTRSSFSLAIQHKML